MYVGRVVFEKGGLFIYENGLVFLRRFLWNRAHGWKRLEINRQTKSVQFE
jgi:hypothetical protein